MTLFAAPVEDILFSLRHVVRADVSAGHDAELAADPFGHVAPFSHSQVTVRRRSA